MIRCDNCGKPATKNFQLVEHIYNINIRGEYSNEKIGNVDTNEFYCEECYKKETETKTISYKHKN